MIQRIKEYLHAMRWGMCPGTVIEEADGERWVYIGRCSRMPKYGMFIPVDEENYPTQAEPIPEDIKGKVRGVVDMAVLGLRLEQLEQKLLNEKHKHLKTLNS